MSQTQSSKNRPEHVTVNNDVTATLRKCVSYFLPNVTNNSFSWLRFYFSTAVFFFAEGIAIFTVIGDKGRTTHRRRDANFLPE